MPNRRGVWSGNVGEWGEVYVLLKMLSSERLYYADSHGERIVTEYNTVRSVRRTESDGRHLTLSIEGDEVVVTSSDGTVLHVDRSEFERNARSLFRRMSTQVSTASHPEQAFLKSLGISSLKAGSKSKGDLTAAVRGAFAGEVTMNYSIKTVLGGRPSLANASGASFIDYELPGFDEHMRDDVMSVKSSQKVVGRIKRILELLDEPPIVHIRSRVFEKNLLKCFYCAPAVIGYALLYGQITRGKQMVDSIALLCEYNPCGFGEEDMTNYEAAICEYLMAIVTDMTPGTPWPRDTNVDGYLLVTPDAEVLSFQTSKIRLFGDYLVLHSCWDTPSTRRHKGVGEVWRDDDGRWFLTLNCAVRYVTEEYSGVNLRYLRHHD